MERNLWKRTVDSGRSKEPEKMFLAQISKKKLIRVMAYFPSVNFKINQRTLSITFRNYGHTSYDNYELVMKIFESPE